MYVTETLRLNVFYGGPQHCVEIQSIASQYVTYSNPISCKLNVIVRNATYALEWL